MPLIIQGLKCDADNCDYQNNERLELDISMVGTPCPNCGSSLLTQADYDATVALDDLINSIDAMFPVPEGEEPALTRIPITLNGTGKFTYKE